MSTNNQTFNHEARSVNPSTKLPSPNEPQIDPDKRYARYSYYHEPPEKPGFKVSHSKGHYRKTPGGQVWVPERWFYIRVDADGLAYRGRGAKARLVADGKADPSIAAATEVERMKQKIEETPSHRRMVLRGDIVPGQPRKKRKYTRRGKYTRRSIAQRVVETVAIPPVKRSSSSAVPIGKFDSIWVPVRGSGELIHGWMDLAHAQYVRNDQLQPEGLMGQVRRDAGLVFTEKFQDVLELLVKVK